MLKLEEKIENGFERFDALDSLGKSPFILGSKLWKEHFDSLSYDVDSSQSQSSTGDLGDFIGIEGQSGKIKCQGDKPDTGKFHSSCNGIMYVALPMRMGAWSMACVLRQRIEYYNIIYASQYYKYKNHFNITSIKIIWI